MLDKRSVLVALLATVLTVGFLVPAVAQDGEVRVLRGTSAMSEAKATKANDITVRNDLIEFSVGVDTAGAYGMPPGVIVDAGNQKTGDMVATLGFVANNFGEWVNYTDIEVITETPEEVVVRSSGNWQGHENVKITTWYTLRAGENHINLYTTVENVGETAQEMVTGYGVSMSGMQTYLPGYGDVTSGMYSLKSADTLPLNWVGGYNENKGTYGFYFEEMTDFTASDTWVDPFKVINLEPGDKVIEEADFYIWEEKDVSKPLATYYELNDIPTGTLRTTVEDSEGNVVPDPYVNIKQDGEKVVTVQGNEEGVVELELAEGDYTLDGGLKSYSENDPVELSVTAEETNEPTYDEVKVPGTVNFSTMIEESGSTPAQVLVNSDGKFRETIYTGFEGEASMTLPPGEYTFDLVYGDNFTTHEKSKDVQVDPGEEETVSATFEKVFHPNEENYYSSDLHHHSNILDGTTPPEDLVKSFLASDLDLTIVSDHNKVDNHEEIKALSDEHGLPFLPSVEITTQSWGHFNAFPLNVGENPMYTGEPAEFFQDARDKGASFIQVNHPNSNGSYFDRTVTLGEDGLELSDDYVGSYDGIEINGSWGDSDEKTLQETYEFWNRGKKYTTVANSDTHNIWQDWGGSGAQRTYAYVDGELTVDSYVEALNEQKAFWSYGPLVYMEANGKVPGETVSDDTVTIRAMLKSTDGLKEATLIKNGEAVKTFDLYGNKYVIGYARQVEGDGWYALKVVEEDGDMAHTNPVWY
ncbi:CehA/McbA family metallohydrolase [Candidatus Bipolaricaulota bacterium]|nr:CehA/McbA family metallohydrolase [Candidatus Bipolaricaulota bacterium]